MPVSKKVRFDVFKRDGFQCGYCGRTPPDVCLEIDHIDPKANGGCDEIYNLITSCFDCNRGKCHVPLSSAPPMLPQNLELLKEKELQLKEYNKFISKIEKRLQKEIEAVNLIYEECFEGWQLSDSFKNSSLRHFLRKLPSATVQELMHLACGRGFDKDRTIRYFCGCCWKRIRGDAK